MEYQNNNTENDQYSLTVRAKVNGKKSYNSDVSITKGKSFIQSVMYLARQNFMRSKISGRTKKIIKRTGRNADSKRTLKRKERVKRIKIANVKTKENKKFKKEEKEFLYNLAKGCLTKEQKDILAARSG